MMFFVWTHTMYSYIQLLASDLYGICGVSQLPQWEVHPYQDDQIPLWGSQTPVVFVIF